MKKGARFVVFVLLASCGGSLVPRADKALSLSLAATNAARDNFTNWDRGHQEQIVAKAASLEDGQTALLSYRARREAVIKAFTVTYTAIGAAASLLPLVEAEKRPPGDLLALVNDASLAFAEVKRLLGEMER